MTARGTTPPSKLTITIPVQTAASVIPMLIGQTPIRPGCSSLVDDHPTRNNKDLKRFGQADSPGDSQPASSPSGAPHEVVAMSKLSEPEILARLPMAKGWERHGDMLVRTWQFPSFRRAIEFVNLVAALIEKTDHHPELIVNYRLVRIEMSTHDVGGLTERDFALIAEINAIPTDR